MVCGFKYAHVSIEEDQRCPHAAQGVVGAEPALRPLLRFIQARHEVSRRPLVRSRTFLPFQVQSAASGSSAFRHKQPPTQFVWVPCRSQYHATKRNRANHVGEECASTTYARSCLSFIEPQHQ